MFLRIGAWILFKKSNTVQQRVSELNNPVQHIPLHRSSLSLPRKPRRLMETEQFHSQSSSKFCVLTLNPCCWQKKKSIKRPRLACIEMGVILGQKLFVLPGKLLRILFKCPSYKMPLSRHILSFVSASSALCDSSSEDPLSPRGTVFRGDLVSPTRLWGPQCLAATMPP